MRIITEKDLRGLLVAVRVFLRSLSGQRLSQAAGLPVLKSAVGGGLSFDEILNKGNWERALAVQEELTFQDYIAILLERQVEVRKIKDEPLWHEPAYGFDVIAEAAHDFYLEVSGQGGKWNIPSALVNLAKAIRDYSLEAILSEKLIGEVIPLLSEKDVQPTYFNYIQAIAKDFNSLPVDDSPTQEETAREEESLRRIGEATGGNEERIPEPEEPAPTEEDPQEQPEDMPYPDENEFVPEGGFESVIVTQKNPNDIKKASLRTVLGNYTVNELLGIVDTISDGRDLTVEEILNKLTNGQFDSSRESAETRSIHRQINADLTLPFIECVNVQGFEMDDQIAAQHDLLHESWDLRTPEARKLHKLLRLIYTQGREDPDLLAAAADIEGLYAEK